MDDLYAYVTYAIEKRKRLEYILNGRSVSICQHCYSDDCPDNIEQVKTQAGIVVECAGFLPYEGRQ